MSLPDFLLDPNVVLEDGKTPSQFLFVAVEIKLFIQPIDSKWRFKSAPDYTVTNANFEASKSTSWETNPQSLEFLVQNLVKNWEKEASHKVDSKEWRTISQEKYEFRLNGGPAQSAEDMLRLGTYNALIGDTGVKDVYETTAMDFNKSHKLFKGALRTFNWEVLEVLGAPPKVSIKWRHWGTMTGNYRATLTSGRTILAKANGNISKLTLYFLTYFRFWTFLSGNQWKLGQISGLTAPISIVSMPAFCRSVPGFFYLLLFTLFPGFFTCTTGKKLFVTLLMKVIEVFGITVAGVNDKFEITSLETFWEPDSMFRQLVTEGIETVTEGEVVEDLVIQNAGSGCPVAH